MATRLSTARDCREAFGSYGELHVVPARCGPDGFVSAIAAHWYRAVRVAGIPHGRFPDPRQMRIPKCGTRSGVCIACLRLRVACAWRWRRGPDLSSARWLGLRLGRMARNRRFSRGLTFLPAFLLCLFHLLLLQFLCVFLS